MLQYLFEYNPDNTFKRIGKYQVSSKSIEFFFSSGKYPITRKMIFDHNIYFTYYTDLKIIIVLFDQVIIVKMDSVNFCKNAPITENLDCVMVSKEVDYSDKPEYLLPVPNLSYEKIIHNIHPSLISCLVFFASSNYLYLTLNVDCDKYQKINLNSGEIKEINCPTAGKIRGVTSNDNIIFEYSDLHYNRKYCWQCHLNGKVYEFDHCPILSPSHSRFIVENIVFEDVQIDIQKLCKTFLTCEWFCDNLILVDGNLVYDLDNNYVKEGGKNFDCIGNWFLNYSFKIERNPLSTNAVNFPHHLEILDSRNPEGLIVDYKALETVREIIHKNALRHPTTDKRLFISTASPNLESIPFDSSITAISLALPKQSFEYYIDSTPQKITTRTVRDHYYESIGVPTSRWNYSNVNKNLVDFSSFTFDTNSDISEKIITMSYVCAFWEWAEYNKLPVENIQNSLSQKSALEFVVRESSVERYKQNSGCHNDIDFPDDDELVGQIITIFKDIAYSIIYINSVESADSEKYNFVMYLDKNVEKYLTKYFVRRGYHIYNWDGEKDFYDFFSEKDV